MTVKEKLQPLCEFLQKQIQDELASQGHIATGALRDSIKVAVEESVHGFAIEGRGSNIAKYVDWGRRPGGRRVPISALLSWIRVKGIGGGRKETDLAWAIQYSIWKNGVPTDRDMRKTQFVTRTLSGAKDRISADVKSAAYEFYGAELHNIIREVKEKINVR